METILSNLKAKWEALKAENPKLRIRDAAKQLEVSEAELLNTGIGQGVNRLNDDFQGLLKETEGLGKVMALTRNDHCVHERKGIYKKVGFNGHVGLVVTPDIDLRLFMSHWHFGFAVNEDERLSLQFFDSDGTAVHKIYLTEHSDRLAYNQLVDKYRAQEQATALKTQPLPVPATDIADEDADLAGFHQDWIALKDTHDFHSMVKKHRLSRSQAIRLAPEGYTVRLELETLKDLLKAASDSQTEIMVFTGSAGCIQIHTGQINRLVETGPWFNVLDPMFNMHLRMDGIAAIWLVKKPTVDGLVHSIEVYNAEGNTIVQFFGKRKPGIPESEAWRTLLSAIPA
ncbi:putative hemin transport protein [bacterium A37T11]|nr:putative hemin transport protein [bacterium A37T11]